MVGGCGPTGAEPATALASPAFRAGIGAPPTNVKRFKGLSPHASAFQGPGAKFRLGSCPPRLP